MYTVHVYVHVLEKRQKKLRFLRMFEIRRRKQKNPRKCSLIVLIQNEQRKC